MGKWVGMWIDYSKTVVIIREDGKEIGIHV